jgi:ABC-2 type transport system ATP-binding protein
MIEISNLSMRYGDLLALDGLDLVIPRGELFAFLGPNAAGKTTTIKLLTGLIEPTSGSARICGYDIQKEPLEAKRRIGYIPDVAEFYDKLTPVEFMAFIAELFQVPHEAAKTRTPELMERFSLVPYARQRIENLSHGTRQRLAFASAFLHEPEVVIVDEPMVGLDPKNARVVKEELKARSREGVTVFLSTHLLNVAQELADRVGIIHHGKLLALGTVEEIRAQAGGRADESLEELFLDLTGGEEETPG